MSLGALTVRMLSSLLKRYGLVLSAGLYTSALILLHALGRFPAPGPYDLAHLAGCPTVTITGKVISFPQTRWGQTRFLFQGRAYPLDAFHGRVAVNFRFPMDDLAPGESLRVRGWLGHPRSSTARHPFDEQRYWAG